MRFGSRPYVPSGKAASGHGSGRSNDTESSSGRQASAPAAFAQSARRHRRGAGDWGRARVSPGARFLDGSARTAGSLGRPSHGSALAAPARRLVGTPKTWPIERRVARSGTGGLQGLTQRPETGRVNPVRRDGAAGNPAASVGHSCAVQAVSCIATIRLARQRASPTVPQRPGAQLSRFGGMSRGTRLALAVRRGTVVVPPRDTAVPLSADAFAPGGAVAGRGLRTTLARGQT